MEMEGECLVWRIEYDGDRQVGQARRGWLTLGQSGLLCSPIQNRAVHTLFASQVSGWRCFAGAVDVRPHRAGQDGTGKGQWPWKT